MVQSAAIGPTRKLPEVEGLHPHYERLAASPVVSEVHYFQMLREIGTDRLVRMMMVQLGGVGVPENRCGELSEVPKTRSRADDRLSPTSKTD